MKPKLRTALYFAGTIIIAALISAGVTMQLYNQNRKDAVMLSTDEYAALTDILALDEIISDIQSDYYYDAPSREALITAAARGMVSELNDPYAQYFTDEEYQKYLTSISGSYDGIGVLLGQPTEQGAEILDVYENTPASEAGLKAGDIVTAVDGTPTANMELEELSTLVVKSGDESTELTIHREGEDDFTVELTSARINVKHVEHFLYNHHTGYIRISMFSGNCAEEFREAVKDLTDRNMTSLVIDLRNNPGS